MAENAHTSCREGSFNQKKKCNDQGIITIVEEVSGKFLHFSIGRNQNFEVFYIRDHETN